MDGATVKDLLTPGLTDRGMLLAAAAAATAAATTDNSVSLDAREQLDRQTGHLQAVHQRLLSLDTQVNPKIIQSSCTNASITSCIECLIFHTRQAFQAPKEPDQ